VPTLIDSNGAPEITGGRFVPVLPFTVMLNAGSVTRLVPSLTPITMPLYAPTWAVVGVPDRRPVVVLNAAHEGLFCTEYVSVAPSGSDAVGWKVYCAPAVTAVAGVPEIVGAAFGAAATWIVNDAREAVATWSVTVIVMRAEVPTDPAVGVPDRRPVVALKFASTGWRMLRYYGGGDQYVGQGPPPLFLRALVAPVLIVSTIVLLATGTALLALDQTEGTLVGLHKASFIVWFGAAAVHVLAHVSKLPRRLRNRAEGLGLRIALVVGAVAAGLVLAVATLPAADQLQDRASAHVHLDED